MDTREQLIARTFDRHLAVIANAGSGKTSVLVNRYVDLIMSGVNPKEIVAITFTRKAAAEMHAKIVEKVENLKKEALLPEELLRLKYIREKLSNARIMTIHSFCSSILRDYPIEAGIQPNFSEITEADRTRITDDSIDSVLEDWLSEKESVKYYKAMLLFERFDKGTVEEFIKEIIRKGEIWSSLSEKYFKGESRLFIDKAIRIIYERIENIIIPAFNELKYIISTIDGNSVSGKVSRQNFLEARSYLEKIGAGFSEGTKNYTSAQFIEMLIELNFICKKIYTKDYTLKVNEFARHIESEVMRERANEIGQVLKGIESLIKMMGYRDKDEELIRFITILFEMTKDVLELIDEEKGMLGAIDFNDMLLKTYKILRDDEVRYKVIRDIKYLMVDEFQDTNPLQYNIIKRLVPDLELSESLQSVNLFIVGDAKQSIYGFRDADVRVFKKAVEEIRVANRKKIGTGRISEEYKAGEYIIIPNSKEESDGMIKLDVSFRMKPQLAAFVNKICREIFNNKKSEFDVDYDELICNVRNDRIIKDDPSSEKNPGRITFLCHKSKGNEKEVDEASNQPEVVAEFIQAIINSNENTIEDKNGNRMIQFSDIAVLGRSRNGFKELIKAFQRQNIPYVMHSGKGFYEAQEIIDIISFLKFLHNNRDSLSLAGLLKSPFFSLSDTDLLEISMVDNGDSLWEKFENYCNNALEEGDNGNEQKYMMLRANRLLNDFMNYGQRIPISFLINKFLCDTGWYGVISDDSSRIQMEANVEKLIFYARNFENRGFKNLYDFVREIELLMESSLESEAVYLTGQNAVNIMTIHSAKGLEFPIVILYNAGSVGSSYCKALINEIGGMSFNLPVFDSDYGVYKPITTPLHYTNRMIEDLSSEAEEKRILYVALTRAKNHIVVSTNENFKSGSIAEILISGLGFKKTDFKKLIQNETVLDFEELIKCYDIQSRETFNRKINVKIDINPVMENISADIGGDEGDYSIPLILMKEPEQKISGELISTTRMLSSEEDDIEYIYRYRLGLPDEEAISNIIIPDGEDSDDDKDAKLSGILIHSILEQSVKWVDSEGKIIDDVFEDIVRNAVITSESNLSTGEIERIERECRMVASSPLFRRYSDRIKTAHTEYSLYLPVDEDIIVGKIDLLLRNSDGVYEIWDWKTNNIETDEKFASLCARYKLQMQIYAYLVWMLKPESEYVIARLLFTQRASENAKDEYWMHSFKWTGAELSDIGGKLPAIIGKLKSKLYGII